MLVPGESTDVCVCMNLGRGVCVCLFGKVKSSASPERSSDQRRWILLVLWLSVHVWKCFSSLRGGRPAYKVLSCPIQEGQEKLSLSADGTHLEQKQIMLFLEMAPIQTVLSGLEQSDS